jgi:hypothetical protein
VSIHRLPQQLAKRSKSSGMAIVEFTIMLPLMLFLLLATAEVGRFIYTYNALTKNVASGARLLSRQVLDGLQTIQLTDPKRTEIRNLVVYGDIDGGATPSIEYLTINDVSVAVSDGDFLQINISYTYRPMFGNSISIPGFGDLNLAVPLNTGIKMRAIN